jgi:hypothetical protein
VCHVNAPMTDLNKPEPSLPQVEQARIKTSVSWKTIFWDWLEHAGKRVGVPNLVIGLTALVLSATSLSYIVANYRLTIAANRPYLVSYGLKIDFDPRSTRASIRI